MNYVFRTYVDTIRQVAADWPETHPEVAERDLQHDRFRTAGDTIVTEAAAIAPKLPEKLFSGEVQHSFSVMFRYCELSAALAQRDGVSQDELRVLLDHPDSFGMLGEIASLGRELTSRVEGELALRLYNFPADGYLGNYQIKDGAVRVKDFPFVVAREKLQLLSEGKQLSEGVCGAHAVGALEPLYRSVVNVAFTDQNLIPRVLESETAHAR